MELSTIIKATLALSTAWPLPLERSRMYALKITRADADTIRFIGSRYDWSDTLMTLGYASQGNYIVPESDAWMIQAAIESDMEGGHNAFPMLDPRSKLASKLADFVLAIV